MYVFVRLPFLGFDVGCLLLLAGLWLIASPERYASGHLADRKRRIALRIIAVFPLLAVITFHLLAWMLVRSSRWSTEIGPVSFMLEALLAVGVITIYLLIRFTISFHIAAKALRSKWRRDDRSIESTAVTSARQGSA